jgi:hypothetical protein
LNSLPISYSDYTLYSFIITLDVFDGGLPLDDVVEQSVVQMRTDRDPLQDGFSKNRAEEPEYLHLGSILLAISELTVHLVIVLKGIS